MNNQESASTTDLSTQAVESIGGSGLRVRGGPPLEQGVELASVSGVRHDLQHGLKEPHGKTRGSHLGIHGQENPVSDGNPVLGPDLDAQLSVCNLKKSYQKGPVVIPVLRGVGLSVRQGELLSIIGKSGSGKSTLLHLLATLDAPDEGEIYFDGQRIDNLAGMERDALRNDYLGMIFQFYHLLPELTTLENVLAPLMIGHSVWGYFRHRREIRKKAKHLLDLVGLSHRLRHKPCELSGGEMQRTAIARALVNDPQVLLADEPTGNLDYGSGREILDLLRCLNAEQNLTIVMVTHDLSIAQMADRSIALVQGRIEEPEADSR